MPDRPLLEKREQETLGPYAMMSADSRGRYYPEEEHPLRTAFQRDKDRVIHSKSFRRLEYKTQVFLNHEGDHYRTRLTHTIEVAQISRTVARSLGLNEDLTEAVALAHDLGHTPFGHVGENVLNECLKDEGGFEHNAQTLRLVELLEHRYPEFPGLNLTYEVRRALTKQRPTYAGSTLDEEDVTGAPLLEAQVVNLADEIAYTSHDVDDGLGSGILKWERLASVPIWERIASHLKDRHASIDARFLRYQGARHLIDRLTTDLVTHTRKNLEDRGIDSVQAVRERGHDAAAFSPQVREEADTLGEFLRENLYNHPGVRIKTENAQEVLRRLFEAYLEDPGEIPPPTWETERKDSLPRRVADYLAGMTDRYALERYRARFGEVPEGLFG